MTLEVIALNSGTAYILMRNVNMNQIIMRVELIMHQLLNRA